MNPFWVVGVNSLEAFTKLVFLDSEIVFLRKYPSETDIPRLSYTFHFELKSFISLTALLPIHDGLLFDQV